MGQINSHSDDSEDEMESEENDTNDEENDNSDVMNDDNEQGEENEESDEVDEDENEPEEEEEEEDSDDDYSLCSKRRRYYDSDDWYKDVEEEEEEEHDTSFSEAESVESEETGTECPSVYGKRPVKREIVASDKKKARVEFSRSSGIHTAPRTLNTQFVGREAELEMLNAAVNKLINSKMIDVAITGLPGVGKSELVLQFINKNSGKFKNIIWLSAESVNAFVMSSSNPIVYIKKVRKVKGTKSNTVVKQLKDLYKYLNENKSLLVLQNLFALDELMEYLPSKTNRSNIMIIATSQIADIPCDLNIALQCLEPQQSLQYLQNNIPDENIEDLTSLSEILCHLPLALETAVAYFKYHSEIWKLDEKTFTIQDLISDNKTKTKQFLHFKTDSDFHDPFYSKKEEHDTKSRLHSMLDKSIEIVQKSNTHTIRYLKYMSYLDHLNLDIELFSFFSRSENHRNLSFKFLQKYSFIKIIDNTKVVMLPIIQSIIRELYIKDSILRDILVSLCRSLCECNGDNSSLEIKLKIQIQKLFYEHAINMNELLEEYNLTFLQAATLGSPSEQFTTLISVYNAVIKCPNVGDILTFNQTYMEALSHIEKYQEMIQASDYVIKKNQEKDFDCSKNVLIIWHFRALALFKLNQLEKSWIVCKNVFHLISEKFKLSFDTINSLALLTEIAVEIKKKDSNSNKFEFCLEIVDHVLFNLIDHVNFNMGEKDFKVLDTITKYYIEYENSELAIKYLNNKILKIKMLEPQEEQFISHINKNHILSYLKLNISKLMYEMNDMITPYNILDTYIPDSLDNHYIIKMLVLFANITSKLEGEIKLVGINHCISYIQEHVDGAYDYESFDQYFNCIQIVRNQLCNSELALQFTEMLRNFEMRLSFQDDDDYEIPIVKLQKAMVTCQHLEMDKAWLIYLDVCKCSNLIQAQNKPAGRTPMLQIIDDTMQHINTCRKSQ